MEEESAAKTTEEGMSSAEVSVPFSWESRPGTPRVKLCVETPLPPLTPPPSYYYSLNNMVSTPTTKKRSKPKLLTSIFQWRSAPIRRTRGDFPSSPASSSSSSSSSSSPSQSWSSRPKWYSLPSSPMIAPNFPGYSSCPRRSYNEEVEEQHEEPHVSTSLRFGSKADGTGSSGCWCSSYIKIGLR